MNATAAEARRQWWPRCETILTVGLRLRPASTTAGSGGRAFARTAARKWRSCAGRSVAACSRRRTRHDRGARGGAPSTKVCSPTHGRPIDWVGGAFGELSRPSVACWVSFLRRPSGASWYRAHNASVVAGYVAHRDLAQAEHPLERFFMDVDWFGSCSPSACCRSLVPRSVGSRRRVGRLRIRDGGARTSSSRCTTSCRSSIRSTG